LPTPTPTATPIVLPTFAAISAPSSSVIWLLVAHDHLFRSSDGGASWDERHLPPGHTVSSTFSFINDREGWFLRGYPPATSCQQQGHELWHTVDGATSWTLLTPDPLGGPLFGQCKRSLTFGDSLRGVLLTSDPYTSPTVHRTTDGGRSWSSVRLPSPAGYTNSGGGNAIEPWQVRWIGSTLLIDGVSQNAGQYVHYFFRSMDGGAMWVALGSVTDVNGALAFVTETRWLQVALPASSRETTDAGKTWHSFTSDYSQAAGVAPQVVFADALVGYATVRGSVQRTGDGGVRWQLVTTPY
jgi:photosystem II stability/assembly factor-like uncharacterized protein